MTEIEEKTRKREGIDAWTYEGQIFIPYTYSAGAVGSRFLIGLRDSDTAVTEHVFWPPKLEQDQERSKTDNRSGYIRQVWSQVNRGWVLTGDIAKRTDNGQRPAFSKSSFSADEVD